MYNQLIHVLAYNKFKFNAIMPSGAYMSEHYQEETWKKIFHRVVIKLGVKLGVAKYNTIKLVIKLHAHYSKCNNKDREH